MVTIVPFTVNDGSQTGRLVSSYMLVKDGKILEVLPYFLFTNRTPQGVGEFINKQLEKYQQAPDGKKKKSSK
jgi:hypothetical protein